MKEKIKQLLSSNNIEDVKIGWELLNLPENKPQGKEWYKYWDILSKEEYDYVELDDLANELIKEVVGEQYYNHPLWVDWEPKHIENENI